MSSTPVLETTHPLVHGAAQEALRDAEGRPLERREAWLLSALVLVGAGLLCAWTLKIDEWGIQTDSLLYSKLALSIWDTLSPLPVVHGEAYAQPTPTYPLLLAPLVGLFPMPAAFVAAHALNALLMASAAVPTYLLARTIGVSPRWALLGGTLAIAVPWVTFSYFLTTESLAYPVLVWAVLAIHAAVVRGGMRADAVALAAIAVAVLTRTQFVVLAGVLPVAVLLQAILERPSPRLREVVRGVLTQHGLLFGAVVGAVFVLGVSIVFGAGSHVAGNYHSLLEGDLQVINTVRAVPDHLALLVVGASVVPFVVGAAWALDALFRGSPPRARAFAIVLGLTVLAILLITTAFNRQQLGDLVHERYAFYVVPLVGVAFVAGLQQVGRLRPVSVVGGTVLVLAALRVFPEASDRAYSYVAPWHQVVKGRAADIGSIVGVDDLGPLLPLCAIALAAAAVMLLSRRGPAWRRWGAVALGAVALVASGTQTAHVLNENLASVNAYAPRQGLLVARDIARGDRDWVDKAMPDGRRVAIVPGVVGDFNETRWLWWDVESWNKSVARSYDFSPAWRDTPFPDRAMRADPATGHLSVEGESAVRHLLMPAQDRRMGVVGRTLALRPPLRLVEAEEPVRAGWWVRGADRDGWSTAGEPLDVRVFPPGDGNARLARVRIQLTSTPQVPGPRRFSVTGARHAVRGTLPRAKQRLVTTRLCVPANAPADARLRVTGSTELSAGKLVGLAVTGVRVAWAGRCDVG